MPVTSFALSNTEWTQLGPAPVAQATPPDSKTNLSGRITGIAAHPTNADIIYLASGGGGVWKSTDGGTTWIPLTDSQATLSMGAIAIAPTNANVIYAGTGEANNRWDSNYGRGILVSTDGGATWTLRTGPGGAFDRLTTSKIAVDPTSPNVAYAAMANMGINSLSSNTGIWKTTDGGGTWVNTTISIDPSTTAPWSDVAVDPNNPSTIYAAIGNLHGAINNGVYKSTDGGINWALLPNAPNGGNTGRITIAVAKSNSQVLYVSDSSPLSITIGNLDKIMRSDNGGGSFTDLTTTPNYMGVQGFYDTALIVDPTNAAVVYAGGQQGPNSLLKSTDSGASWTDISSGAAGSATPHINHHAFSIDVSGRLLDGNDGGIYRLDDSSGPTWTNLNGNLGTILFYGIGLHPTDAGIAVGGTADNGTVLYTGNMIWALTDSDGAGFDGGFAKFSKTNPNRVYHQSPPYSAGWDFFRRSDDGGQTWSTETSTMLADPGNPILGPDVDQLFAPFVVDPYNGDRVLYGTIRVWETVDGGAHWSRISDVNTSGFNNNSNRVDAIGLAPFDANTVYVATGGDSATTSQIFVTTNHGSSWTEHNLGVGGRVKDIQVDPVDSRIAYAVISTFNGTNGQVFKTTNGGGSWTNISGDLPVQPVWSLQIDPTTGPSTLYVGADDGVYATIDGGSTWSRFGTALPNSQVFQIELNTSLHILGAATHGRGLWEISTPVALTGVSFVSVTPPSPSAVGSSVTFSASASGGSGTYEYQFLLRNPSGVWSTQVYSSNDSWTWDTTNLNAGTYLIEVRARNAGSTAAYQAYAQTSYVLVDYINVVPKNTSFGDVGVGFTSFPATFTVTNVASQNVTLGSLTVGGTNGNMFNINNGTCGTLPRILAPGDSCKFTATFTPATTGGKTATITVVTSDPVVPSKILTLTGTGSDATNAVQRTLPTPVTPYSTLGAAFSAATATTTLQAWGILFTEPAVSVNSTGIVTFGGGYDTNYATNTGTTGLKGVLTVTKGTLVVSNLTIM